MTSDTSGLKREIEGFKQFTSKLSDKINGIGDIWQDSRGIFGRFSEAKSAIVP